MIVKHIPMRSTHKSDFAGLINYLTDAQSKEHRLGHVKLTKLPRRFRPGRNQRSACHSAVEHPGKER
ncbi:hypothetical protein ABDK09_09830 [Vibrio sp. CDRSL-10 TSBA]